MLPKQGELLNSYGLSTESSKHQLQFKQLARIPALSARTRSCRRFKFSMPNWRRSHLPAHKGYLDITSAETPELRLNKILRGLDV